MAIVKLYAGEQVEIDYAYTKQVGTVTGHYEDGTPRVVNSAGHVILFPSYVFTEPSRIAVLKASPQRKAVDEYFNRRKFFARLVYLFSGKMPD